MRTQRARVRGARAFALALTLVVVLPVAAWADPSFENSSVPADSDATLRLKVPEHRVEEDHVTVRVDITLPEGFEVLGCTPPARGWSCLVSGEVVRYRSDRSLTATPTDMATYQVLVHTPGPGTYAVRTVQWYQDNHWTAWTVGGGTAPKVTVTGSMAPSPTPKASPTSSPKPSPKPSPAPTRSPSPSPQPTTPPQPAEPSEPAQDESPAAAGETPSTVATVVPDTPGASPHPAQDDGPGTVLDGSVGDGQPVSGSGPVPDDATLEQLAAEAAADETTARESLLLVATGLLGIALTGTLRARKRDGGS